MKRILVVDDDSMIAHMLVDFLTTVGYDATFEPNGLRALQHVDLRSPDLVILDLMLPVVTGVEVARRLKLDRASRDIPILAITGVDQPDDLADVLLVDAIMTKPIDLEHLDREIQTLLTSNSDQASGSSGWEFVSVL